MGKFWHEVGAPLTGAWFVCAVVLLPFHGLGWWYGFAVLLAGPILILAGMAWAGRWRKDAAPPPTE